MHDVAIVGGGPVGATLACALAARGARVAIVEAAAAPEPPAGEVFDNRVSALTRASEGIFRSLGVWEYMARERMSAFREMHVWDAAGRGEIHFDSAEIGVSCLGHIVENRVIQAALERRLARFDQVRWYRPASLTSLRLETDRAVLDLDGTQVSARVAVGADGARSRLRELAGIQQRVSDYRQRAVVCSVRTSLPHRETAWQRFLPDGPIAFLPLPRGHCSIVWSTRPEHAQTLLDLSDAAFALAMEEALDSRLGGVSVSGPRNAFPLFEQHAERYVANRVALVGDAAHTIHPLAGQGLNLGLLDAAALAEVHADATTRGRDPGREANLRRYERWRKSHNTAMRWAMEGFRQLFGSGLAPVRGVRNVGLDLVDRIPALKRAIMQQASGLDGDLPALARHDARRSGRDGLSAAQ